MKTTRIEVQREEVIKVKKISLLLVFLFVASLFVLAGCQQKTAEVPQTPPETEGATQQ